MPSHNKKRLYALDVLKAYAIIAVLIYHMGGMPMGYLGVDIFLVVNGFLLANRFKQLDSLNDGINFLSTRIVRLWPITLVAVIFCLIWGAIWMLPFSYRILLRDIMATSIFANNILFDLLSNNYWNITNDYNPLMHTWYLGIVMQFYLVMTFILVVTKNIFKSNKDITNLIVISCLIISFSLYISPCGSETDKFFNIQYRFFEFCIGIITALVFKNKTNNFFTRFSTCISIASFSILILYMCYGVTTYGKLNVITTNILTAILLLSLPHVNGYSKYILHNKYLATIGKASLSIYIWHQIVLAFYRVMVPYTANISTLILLLTIIALLSYISYTLIENILTERVLVKQKPINVVFKCLIAICMPILCVTWYLYTRSGILRDVPELGIKSEETSSRMHIKYNDRIYQYDRDFSSPNKIHWYVYGNSFGRDWINILLESGIEKEVEISYSMHEINMQRALQADIIFCVMGIAPNYYLDSSENFIKELKKMNISTDKVFFVGGKKFGVANHEYTKRYFGNYPNINASAKIEDVYFINNDKMIKKWGDRFIDLFSPVMINNHVRVFTDDLKFISHDCLHLTSFGACFYAEKMKELIRQLIIISNKADKSL